MTDASHRPAHLQDDLDPRGRTSAPLLAEVTGRDRKRLDR